MDNETNELGRAPAGQATHEPSPPVSALTGECPSRVCQCAVCRYYADVARHLALLEGAQRSFFEDMYSRLCHAEMDRDWNAHKIKEAFAQGMETGTAETLAAPGEA